MGVAPPAIQAVQRTCAVTRSIFALERPEEIVISQKRPPASRPRCARFGCAPARTRPHLRDYRNGQLLCCVASDGASPSVTSFAAREVAQHIGVERYFNEKVSSRACKAPAVDSNGGISGNAPATLKLESSGGHRTAERLLSLSSDHSRSAPCGSARCAFSPSFWPFRINPWLFDRQDREVKLHENSPKVVYNLTQVIPEPAGARTNR